MKAGSESGRRVDKCKWGGGPLRFGESEFATIGEGDAIVDGCLVMGRRSKGDACLVKEEDCEVDVREIEGEEKAVCTTTMT